MAGFNSPNILFLNTYDTLDRKYIKELAPKLKSHGYEKYVELYCGAFVMPLIVAAEGFKPEQIYCYDISLFSNILGYTFSGKDVVELQVKKNGELIELNGKDNVENAAILIFEQALARLKKAEHIDYFRFLVNDMEEFREKHILAIDERVRKMDDVLHGLHFERLYIWEAYEKEQNSEKTFICSNPPTYKGAFEKFFDTDGVITWIGDDYPYEVWDGARDCPKLLEKSRDKTALLMFLQQADKGHSSSKTPVSARYLSLTQNVYWNTNKPELVEEIMGKKQETATGVKRIKSKYPILPYDAPIKADSRIDVFVEDNSVAEYYRRLWLHRITGKSVSVHLCVLIDGYIAGFIGLDLNAIIKPYNDSENSTIILSYAVPAPNKTCRLARLLVELAKSKKIINNAMSKGKNTQQIFYTTVADSLCTVEYSRFPEVKGLRGLMKIKSKKKMADNLNALVYQTELNDNDEKTALRLFVEKEERYKNARK